MKKTTDTDEFDWDSIIHQIHDMIGTNTALFSKYGLILASNISHFKKGTLISPTILDFIERKNNLIHDLKVEKINCLVLEGDKTNIVFTFGQEFNLMSNVPKNVNLAQYMPSISNFLTTLHKSHLSKDEDQSGFELLSLEQEFKEIQDSTSLEVEKDRFPIFKHLIQYLTKK